MMIEYHTIEKDAWEISQCYYKIYDTSTTRSDPVALQVGWTVVVMISFVLYVYLVLL